MVWSFAFLGSVSVSVVVVVVVSVVVLADSAGACSFARAASVSFRGTASAIDVNDGAVTFRIDDVRWAKQASAIRDVPAPVVSMPGVSETLLVEYRSPGDAGELEVGEAYLVEAHIDADSDRPWYSTSRDHFFQSDTMCSRDRP